MGWAVYDDAWTGDLKPITFYDLEEDYADFDAAFWLGNPDPGQTLAALDTGGTVFDSLTSCVDTSGTPGLATRPTIDVEPTSNPAPLGIFSDLLTHTLPENSFIAFGGTSLLLEAIDNIGLKPIENGQAQIYITSAFPYQDFETNIEFGSGGSNLPGKLDQNGRFRFGKAESQPRAKYIVGQYYKVLGDLPTGFIWTDAGTELDREDYSTLFEQISAQAKADIVTSTTALTAVTEDLTGIFQGRVYVEIYTSFDYDGTTAEGENVITALTATTATLLSVFLGTTGTKFIRLIPSEFVATDRSKFKLPENAGWAIYAGADASAPNQRQIFDGSPKIIRDNTTGGWFERYERQFNTQRVGWRLNSGGVDNLEFGYEIGGDTPLLQYRLGGIDLSWYPVLSFTYPNTVNFQGLMRLKPYTVDQLLSITSLSGLNGLCACVSNGDGSKCLVIYDGTNWRFPDGTIVLSTNLAIGSWTNGTGWSQGSGQATRTAVGTQTSLTQTIAGLVAGATYETVYTVSAMSAASVFFRITGSTLVDGVIRSAVGTYTEDLVAPAVPVSIAIRGGSAFAGSITLASITFKRKG